MDFSLKKELTCPGFKRIIMSHGCRRDPRVPRFNRIIAPPPVGTLSTRPRAKPPARLPKSRTLMRQFVTRRRSLRVTATFFGGDCGQG